MGVASGPKFFAQFARIFIYNGLTTKKELPPPLYMVVCYLDEVNLVDINHSDKCNTLRSTVSKLKLLIIEVSMIGSNTLLVHRRLQQIMPLSCRFGGVSVLAVGDLYQIPPIMHACNLKSLRLLMIAMLNFTNLAHFGRINFK